MHLYLNLYEKKKLLIYFCLALFEGKRLKKSEPYHLNLNHNQECITLSDYDTDDEGNFVRMVKGNSTVKKRIFVEYKDTDNPNLVSKRSDLQKYNKLLKQTYVDIPALEEPFITRQLKNGNTQRVQINQTGKFVRRIFSRGSCEMNGRFYGGFWQQIREDLRKKIYINDNPTVEVDYNPHSPSNLPF